MNKERLLELADLLESEKVVGHFDMDYFFKSYNLSVPTHTHKLGAAEALNVCGTVACIAGWAVAAFNPKLQGFQIDYEQIAADLLGLRYEQADRLFTPSDNGDDCDPEDEDRSPYAASAKQAAKVVRHLAETGEVDWSKAFD